MSSGSIIVEDVDPTWMRKVWDWLALTRMWRQEEARAVSVAPELWAGFGFGQADPVVERLLGAGLPEAAPQEFDQDRLDALARYVIGKAQWDGSPMSGDRLACILFLSDMEAFRRHGRSITGATWVKGVRVPYVRECGGGEGWMRGFAIAHGAWE